MQSITLDSLRLFVHITAACIWVGGQIVLAAIVPVVRKHAGRETTLAIAHQFQRIAWPAFAVLLATGAWNLSVVNVGDRSSAYLTSLFVKLMLVFVSGACAAAHTVLARSKPAVGGALAGIGLVAALGATLLGTTLHLG